MNHTSVETYLVKVDTDILECRSGPDKSYRVLSTITDRGIYDILQEVDGYGQLKSRIGWIDLSYTHRI